jgi:Phytanoyl-CoA dioxygenase (PhyH)
MKSVRADQPVVGFETDGYRALSIGLHSEMVADVRRHLSTLSYLANGVGVDIRAAMAIPQLQHVIFSPTLLQTLRSLLGGDICIFPNITARRNSQTAWHVDEAFRSTAVRWGHRLAHDFVQATVYFQDNIGQGGGLDVIPSSHIYPAPGDEGKPLPETLRSLLDSATTVSSKAGEAVLWDGRLVHRSSLKTSEGDNYAIHWTCGVATADISGFLGHIVRRGRNVKDVYGVDRRYGVIESFQFERDAPTEFIMAARTAGVSLIDTTNSAFSG